MNTPALRIQLRPCLVCGVIIRHEPTGRCRIVLNESLEEDRAEMATTLWHELLHFIELSLGHHRHSINEEKTEAMAKKLAATCPEIIELCAI
jgi:hypothetical protein